jgi:hypothetical protein
MSGYVHRDVREKRGELRVTIGRRFRHVRAPTNALSPKRHGVPRQNAQWAIRRWPTRRGSVLEPARPPIVLSTCRISSTSTWPTLRRQFCSCPIGSVNPMHTMVDHTRLTNPRAYARSRWHVPPMQRDLPRGRGQRHLNGNDESNRLFITTMAFRGSSVLR